MKIVLQVLLIFWLFSSCSSGPKRSFWGLFGKHQVDRTRVSVQYGPTVIEGPKTFRLVNKRYGLNGIKATNIYSVDFNGDGYTDIVTLPEHFSSPQFYQYVQSEKKFIKIAYDPFIEKNYCSFLSFVDFDRDGIYDLLMGTLNQKTELSKYPLRIFKGKIVNKRIRYREIIGGLPEKIFPTTSVGVVDYDLDGHLDLFLGNWYDFTGKNRTIAPDVLLKGKGFSFKNVSHILGNEAKYSKGDKIYPNALPTMGVSTCDLNQDGYPDFLTAISSGYSNKLWINTFDRKRGRIFKNYGKASHYANDSEGDLDPRGGGNTFFTACADYNNDGFMDIVMGELSHSYDSESKDRSTILTGSTNRLPLNFIRSEYYMDDGTFKWSQADRRGGWFDYNLDGLVDLFVVNSGFPPKSRLIIFEQAEDHSFQDVAQKLGVDIVNPSGTVIADFNRDGRLDIITGQTHVRDASIKDELFLFENSIDRKERKSLRIHLRGKKANFYGIGAMVILKSSKRVQRRWVEYSSGPFPSQHEEGVYFGLASNEAPLELIIHWPIKAANGKHLVKKYNLANFKRHKDFTVYENGKLVDQTKYFTNM